LITTIESTHPKDIKNVTLGNGDISINEIIAVSRYDAEIFFSKEYRDRVNDSRAAIENFLDEERVIYGVTTGFGSNVTKNISLVDAESLQNSSSIYERKPSKGNDLRRNCLFLSFKQVSFQPPF
jgi:histidine ammonia-lyase